MANFRQGTDLQTIHVCDTDPTIGLGIPGGTPNLLLIRTDNNSLYYYVGPSDTDWRLFGAVPPTSATQIFKYTANGTETAVFTIHLPAARADINYQVQVQQAGPAINALKLIQVLNLTKAVNAFDIQLSSPAELGDVFYFTVEDPT